MQMERNGALKDATETILIILTTSYMSRLQIVRSPSALLMETRTDHVFAGCIIRCVKHSEMFESTA